MADVLDSDYVIDTESLKNNIEDGITFLGTEGTKRTKIVLDPTTDRWTVIDKDGDKIMYLDDQVNSQSNPNQQYLDLLPADKSADWTVRLGPGQAVLRRREN